MDWISVKDRLPKAGTDVLVCCTMKVTDNVRYEKAIAMAYVCEDGFIDVELDKAITAGVTHWMELPEPPKEGK